MHNKSYYFKILFYAIEVINSHFCHTISSLQQLPLNHSTSHITIPCH